MLSILAVPNVEFVLRRLKLRLMRLMLNCQIAKKINHSAAHPFVGAVLSAFFMLQSLAV